MKDKWKKRIIMILFLGLSMILLYPLLITFTNSFMSNKELLRHYAFGKVSMYVIPEEVTFSGYIELLFTRPQYLVLFWNSVKITIPVIIGQTIVSLLAAYGFTRTRFRGKKFIWESYIVMMLLPVQVALVPNYIVIQKLQLMDRLAALILPGIFNPFGAFLLTNFMREIPEEYIEAAEIDGAGHKVILMQIFIPLLKPGLFALTILTLIEYWNLVEPVLVFIKDAFKQPLSIYLSYIGEDVRMIFAASCFYMIPVLLVFLYGQDDLVQGLERSGIKG
ncbi:MAG: carbohydrate ABC transporter permease [Cellulosilyticum sp.]|nr:carbohydrate ABC transporter permease [Cellulosilyticum sp.]